MKHDIKHLAIIMDGNSRWAQKNCVGMYEGYKQGAIALNNLLPKLVDLNIPYISFYTFSTENWQRPTSEINILFKLFNSYIEESAKMLHNMKVRVKVIGRTDIADDNVQKKISEMVDMTKFNEGMTVCFAFSYGGRAEIIDAINKFVNSDIRNVLKYTDIYNRSNMLKNESIMCEQNIHERNITEDIFRNYLYDSSMPDVDLLIRSGNEHRISNFLLWHIAYAELYFLEKYWPEIKIDDILLAISSYSLRKRSFGGRNLSMDTIK